jgi:putative ABC transport system substrate-binding protein
MRRRDFITLFGGAAAWPLAARAQQANGVRRVGWLDSGDGIDEASQANRAALPEALAKLGWIEGRNLKIEQRFSADNANRLRAAAVELVSLAPDAIVASGAAATRAVQLATQIIPIVFTGGGDAAANGLVKDIARPEGNTTGFSSTEPTAGSKWLELLKEAAPRLGRILIVFNSELARSGPNYVATIEPAARALAVQTVMAPFRDAVELVRSIDAFASKPNGGLMMLPPPFIADRATILKLAVEHRLPAIYPQRALAIEGGLISYGADALDQNLRAASYVDRILRGAKMSELPVQFPTKYELVVNLRAAKAIGLTIPEALLLRADEVIE